MPMWENLSKAVQWLQFDLVELRFENKACLDNQNATFLWWNKERIEDRDNDWDSFLKRKTLMKLELPLTPDQTRITDSKGSYGTLWLIKDLKRDPLSHSTLRRIEHLRRTVIKTIKKIG